MRTFRGERRCNDTRASATDPQARTYRKSDTTTAHLCHMGHVLMENRNGLVVDVHTPGTTRTAEREAALDMLAHGAAKAKALGGYMNCETHGFVRACRARVITRHVAAMTRASAPDGLETYRVSLRIRKRTDEVFGCLKTVAGLRKIRLIGTATLAEQSLHACAADNLVRMGNLERPEGRQAHLRGRCPAKPPKVGTNRDGRRRNPKIVLRPGRRSDSPPDFSLSIAGGGIGCHFLSCTQALKLRFRRIWSPRGGRARMHDGHRLMVDPLGGGLRRTDLAHCPVLLLSVTDTLRS